MRGSAATAARQAEPGHGDENEHTLAHDETPKHEGSVTIDVPGPGRAPGGDRNATGRDAGATLLPSP
ncbi:hypothetical protein GCM10010151_37920 [Actinoallomurus spadix]|uniref:Uncharacterized protein n=1 Tax=Actinoallomurus spadix TaxID=79912 RepID=A0ABP3GFZ9_9ACTN